MSVTSHLRYEVFDIDLRSLVLIKKFSYMKTEVVLCLSSPGAFVHAIGFIARKLIAMDYICSLHPEF